MIANLEIKNFTTFGKLKFSLSPRVNVIIGSNGTGKTHLLKAIYGLALAGQPSLTEQSDKKLAAAVSRKFLRIFSPAEPPPTKVEGFSGFERLRREVIFFSD